MKKLLWICSLVPGFLNAQGLIEAPLEQRIANTIVQYNKEKLPGYFTPVFGVFIRPENTLLFQPNLTVPQVGIVLEMKFYRYQRAFGLFRLQATLPALPSQGGTGSIASRYAGAFRAGTALGGGYHILDTRNEAAKGHALSLMGLVVWEFFGGPSSDGAFYNSLGLEFETRYQYNFHRFAAFALGFYVNYKGIFYSLNQGHNIIDKGHGLSYGVTLGFMF